MSKRALASSVGIIVMILIPALGCGDDTAGSQSDGSGGGEPPPSIGLPVEVRSITKPELQAQANQICRRSWKEMEKDAVNARKKAGYNVSDARLFAQLSQGYLSYMQFWFDDISYLGAPKGERVQVEDMMKALQLAVYSGEERKIPSPEMMAAVFGSFNQLAREYGLNECLVKPGSFSRG